MSRALEVSWVSYALNNAVSGIVDVGRDLFAEDGWIELYLVSRALNSSPGRVRAGLVGMACNAAAVTAVINPVVGIPLVGMSVLANEAMALFSAATGAGVSTTAMHTAFMLYQPKTGWTRVYELGWYLYNFGGFLKFGRVPSDKSSGVIRVCARNETWASVENEYRTHKCGRAKSTNWNTVVSEADAMMTKINRRGRDYNLVLSNCHTTSIEIGEAVAANPFLFSRRAHNVKNGAM